MPARTPAVKPDQFTTFGDLLKYLRRRAGLTQRELSIAVGYSDAMISRLEQNQRLPDLATLSARFLPALAADEAPDLAQRLLDLAAAVRREDAPTAGLPPFKGLLHFEEADADLFFGREALTERLVARVLALLAAPGQRRFLAIVGASGSGKSSVLRAGLLNALRWNPATAAWPAHMLTPTAHPLEALAASLLGGARSSTARVGLAETLRTDPQALDAALRQQAARASVGQILLAVDQFEELFTLCRAEADRRAFVDHLLGVAEAPAGPALVVLALRADFYAHCADYPALREALAQQQEFIGAMTAKELRCAIEAPAHRGRWELEPGLVEVLLGDIGADGDRPPEPGALPLLSHALLETWQRRRGHTLTLSGYTAAGGVRGAIAETAEAVFHDQLNPSQRAIARDIFVRLTELGADEAVPDTRRRVALGELLAREGQAGAVREVLTLLADARLITTEQDEAEVAHEALIREWPTLREWLAEDREGLRLHRRLTEAARDWEHAGRDEGQLYRGARLAQALEWATAHGAEVNSLERAFLDESQAFAERDAAEREAARQRELQAAQQLAEAEGARAEAQQQRAAAEAQRAEEQARAARRLRQRALYLLGALVVALSAALLAGFFGQRASQNLGQAQAANTQAAAQQATAVAESVRADQQRDAAQAEANSRATQQAVAEAERERADQQAELALAAEAAAQADRDRAEQIAAEALARELALQSSLNLAVDPERSILLALAALDAAPLEQAFSALQAATQASRLVWAADPQAGRLLDVAYTPDGRRLVTGGDDGVVRVWDTATGDLLEAWPGHTDRIWVLAVTRDGQRLATGSDDGTVRIWDMTTGQTVHVLEVGEQISSVDFSPDGERLAVVGWPHPAVYFYDTANGALLETLTHPEWATAEPAALVPGGAVYSPDGARVAIALNPRSGTAGQVEIWDARTGERLLILPERFTTYRNGLAFSPDGARLATPSSQGGLVAAVWDVATGARLFTLGEEANRIRFSADGQRLLTASAGGRAHVWNAATGGELLALVANASGVPGVAESPECAGPPQQPYEWCGRWLAAVSTDGKLRLWDVSPMGAGVPLVVPGGGGPGSDFAFGDEGRRLDALVRLDASGREWLFQQWRLPDQPGPPPAGPTNRRVTLDPGLVYWWYCLQCERGQGYVVVYETGRLYLLDQGGVTVADFCCVDPAVSAVRLSRDNGVVAVLSRAGVLEVWDTAQATRLSSVHLPELPQVGAMALDSGGARAALVVSDTLRVINARTGEIVLNGVPLPRSFQGGVRFTQGDDAVIVEDCAGSVVTVYEIPSGEQRLSVSVGTSGCIFGADIGPDGSQLAVATRTGPLTVWDTATSEKLFELPRLDFILNPRFSPDGRLLYAIVVDSMTPVGSIRAYFTKAEDLIAFARSRLTRWFTPEECREYLHVEVCPTP